MVCCARGNLTKGLSKSDGSRRFIPAVGMAVRDQDRALAFYIAELVAFLMSDAGACISGQLLKRGRRNDSALTVVGGRPQAARQHCCVGSYLPCRAGVSLSGQTGMQRSRPPRWRANSNAGDLSLHPWSGLQRGHAPLHALAVYAMARRFPTPPGSQSNNPALASRLRRCSAGSGTGTAATSRWVYSVSG